MRSKSWRGACSKIPARSAARISKRRWRAKKNHRWQARYKDADGKYRSIGYFDTQEAAAHAVNAAIRRAGLEGSRKTNPVVDGQLVPRALKAPGHGPPRKSRKRRRDESAAAPSTRARRPRRAATYDDSEPDDDYEEDLELGPPDDDGGWD